MMDLIDADTDNKKKKKKSFRSKQVWENFLPECLDSLVVKVKYAHQQCICILVFGRAPGL